ncbi:hypothetical protein OpiT1DRAFT_05582 [Opitutaceae bacterium TAV1]|nr:hypothetical protein OpiT1DRAFT_01448 [Opitutaceae bacterium TAV1]EIQ01020.1 hypothetical protein OpiT1DRAFT_05582 [Opitutaceae bacterium TAV1]
MKDYIPHQQAVFHTWQEVLIAYLLEKLSAFGLTTAELEPLMALQATWRDAWAAASNPATRTPAAIKAKEEAMAAYIAGIRQFVQEYLTKNHRVSDADRLNMGLPIHDTTPTPAPVPATRPIGEADFSEYLVHTLRVRDSASGGEHKLPHTVGFEVWRKIGGETMPGIDEMHLVALALHSPYRAVYPSAQQNQRVWYAFRWVSTRGEKGPWSEIISAIIP